MSEITKSKLKILIPAMIFVLLVRFLIDKTPHNIDEISGNFMEVYTQTPFAEPIPTGVEFKFSIHGNSGYVWRTGWQTYVKYNIIRDKRITNCYLFVKDLAYQNNPAYNEFSILAYSKDKLSPNISRELIRIN